MVFDDIIRNEIEIKCGDLFTPARPAAGKKESGLPFFSIDAPVGMFASLSLSDQWMWLVKNNEPILDYDVFLRNGFKIKGIVIKDRRVNLAEVLRLLGGNFGTQYNETEFYETTKLSDNSPGRATSTRSLTENLSFSYLPFIISSSDDIKKHQDAFIRIAETWGISEENKWIQLQVLICEHVETGREVVHQMSPQKGWHNPETADMYITYLETSDGRISRIDNYNENQLSFLYPAESDIYNGVCDKEAIVEIRQQNAFHCRNRRI